MQVWCLGWQDLLEEGMVTHSSILAWRTAWTEEPGKLQCIGLQRDAKLKWLGTHSIFIYMKWDSTQEKGFFFSLTCTPLSWQSALSLWQISWKLPHSIQKAETGSWSQTLDTNIILLPFQSVSCVSGVSILNALSPLWTRRKQHPLLYT